MTMIPPKYAICVFLMATVILGCPDDIGWIPAGGSCYRVSNDHMNWFEAQIVSIVLIFIRKIRRLLFHVK